MKVIIKKKYLTIPADEGFGNCNLLLKDAMNRVADEKGYKNAKAYYKKKFGCSGNSIKLMTKSKIFPFAETINNEKYPTIREYWHINKIDIDNYAKVIADVVNEYKQIATLDKRKCIMESIENWRLNPKSYQQVFCIKVFNGFYNIVEQDEKTANYVNGTNNAKDIYEKIINELSNNQVEVRL